ncbi:Retrovirus-related Pol polyprotein from transposon RE2 [Vitis vinifera]|uniref:Retrovirus-related Pol polyprotein from transposon RE2 n=1 Tax=Vitis vinifera TaxID=29760 RepID=A0A438DZT6_VITVI|nr:Retrovirus-related Pol polyprotein from transposon RE2 [Vitis vinifera]
MNGSSPTPHTSSTSFIIPFLQTMSQTSSHPSLCSTTLRPVSPSVPSPPTSTSSLHPMTTHLKVGTFKPKLLPDHITYLSTTISPSNQLPNTVSQALKNHNWYTTMLEEYQAFVWNTWTLVLFHPSMNVIDNAWIFRVKYNSDGTIQWKNARLVAKGFQQYAGLEFTNTFSLVIKASIIRVVFTLVVTYNWEIHQIDFNNAFLNEDIAKIVYISQPVGFVSGISSQHVSKPVPTPMSATLKLHVASGPASSDPTLYKSTIGVLQYLTYTRSSIEAKYCTLAHASTEVAWLCSLFSELGVSLVNTPVIWCDNQCAGALATGSVFHSQTKHIEVDVHYVCEQVLAHKLVVSYVPSVEQVADLFIKPFSIPSVEIFPSFPMAGAIDFPHLLERLCSVLYLIIRGYLAYMATGVKRTCLGYVWGCTLFFKVRLDSLRLCELPFDVAPVFGRPMWTVSRPPRCGSSFYIGDLCF